MDGFPSIYQINSGWIIHHFTETLAQLQTDPSVQRNCDSGTSRPTTNRTYLALLFLFILHYSHHDVYILHFHAWKKKKRKIHTKSLLGPCMSLAKSTVCMSTFIVRTEYVARDISSPTTAHAFHVHFRLMQKGEEKSDYFPFLLYIIVFFYSMFFF